MITADQLPDDAVAAAEYEACCEARPNIRKVIAAAINAWPGMAVNDSCPVWHAYPHIILSLTTENTND